MKLEEMLKILRECQAGPVPPDCAYEKNPKCPLAKKTGIHPPFETVCKMLKVLEVVAKNEN